MSTTDVFISYARADRPIAQVFAEALIEEGFNVWWDASLHSGETFDEVIEQRLRDAKAVVRAVVPSVGCIALGSCRGDARRSTQHAHPGDHRAVRSSDRFRADAYGRALPLARRPLRHLLADIHQRREPTHSNSRGASRRRCAAAARADTGAREHRGACPRATPGTAPAAATAGKRRAERRGAFPREGARPRQAVGSERAQQGPLPRDRRVRARPAS